MHELPHNIEAEESLLGSLLIDDQAIRSIVGVVKPSDFYSQRNALIYEACFKLYSNIKPTNQVLIAEELKQRNKLADIGGSPYLSHLISVCATPLDVKHYADIVASLSRSRQLVNLSESIAKIGYDADLDGITKAEGLWTKYKQQHLTNSQVVTPLAAGNDILSLYEKYQEPACFPSWGFIDLDEITAGVAPEYVIFGARTSIGKTQLLLDIIENLVSQRKNVLLCSAEMTSEQIYERKISREIALKILDLRKHGLNERQKDKLVEMSGKVSESTFNHISGGLSFSDVYQAAYTLKNQGKLDVLVVDYIGALRDCYTENKDTQTTRISRVSNKIQSMQHEFKIPVLAACQLNREIEKSMTSGLKEASRQKRPRLSDLRDSGSLEQDADVVFLLHREIDKNQNYSDVLEVKMAKNRQLGPAAHIELLFKRSLNKYVDMLKREVSSES